jgi:nitrite reductase/ring-hydroxylating ferredoxin subunit
LSWRPVASLGAAAAARPWLPIEAGGRSIVLAAVDGAWYGVEDACSHAGCPFSSEASLEGSTIVCNCHGSEFDITTGDVLRGPAEYPIRTVPVRVVGDAIEVDV